MEPLYIMDHLPSMVTVNGTNGTICTTRHLSGKLAAIYARVFDLESFPTDTGMAAIFGEMETTFDPGVEGRNNWDHPRIHGVLGLQTRQVVLSICVVSLDGQHIPQDSMAMGSTGKTGMVSLLLIIQEPQGLKPSN